MEKKRLGRCCGNGVEEVTVIWILMVMLCGDVTSLE